MRVSTALLTAGAAAILLSACSGAGQTNGVAIPPTSTGLNFLRSEGHAAAVGHPVHLTGVQRVLYVADAANNAVEVLKYRTWTNLGAITDGIGEPVANWVDRLGNLYVANAYGPNVTEYDPTGNLIFTYSTGMTFPNNVTTDKHGNVYEVDQANTVNEYAQRSNTVTASCNVGGDPNGVAVDKYGSVFVQFTNFYHSFNNYIVVYPGGLNVHGFSCANLVLLKLGGEGGIALDKQGNVVACVRPPTSSVTPAVDIVAPPYNSVTGTLGSGWSIPLNVSIDKAGTQAYVTDLGDHTVRVVSYPGGSTIATLGSANGLTGPRSAVDSYNYDP